MKLAPIDIIHKTFSKKLAGFDSEEVGQFLKEIAEQMEALVLERNNLKETMRERDIQILEYREKEKSLKETLMMAHKMTEQLRKDAEREASLIINDANQRAEVIVRDARDSLRKTYQDISEMKRMKVQFEVGLKNLVASQLELLERSAGYMPHVPASEEMPVGGSTPNMRAGRPIES